LRHRIPYFCGACAGAPQNAYFCGKDSVEHHPCATECIFWCATEEVFPTSDVLEDKVSGLVAQVMLLKECDSYLIEIIESACEQLKCKFSTDHLDFPAASLGFVLC
jgi:hypothetical protein